MKVKSMLLSIPDDKSPGIDGFSSCFFKNSWEIPRQYITSAIQGFFHTGRILKEINVTAITLIPKTCCPAEWVIIDP